MAIPRLILRKIFMFMPFMIQKVFVLLLKGSYQSNRVQYYMDQEQLKQLNQKFTSIVEQVKADYKHDEATYKSAQQIFEFILKNCKAKGQNITESILMLGKTGWGKSTSINYLSSIPLIVDENSHLKPKSAKDAISQIGGGFSSTTLFPVPCLTPFGHVLDMPGDEETRGAIVEMINCICKKQIAKSLKKIKIVLVIPASTMSSAGSYGKGLKEILEANNKFLGGINRFKKSVMFLITFSGRLPKIPQLTIQDIRKCLDHQDGALRQYKELIDYVIENKQIKFFAKPSEEAEVNSLYTAPDSPNWKQNSSQEIVKVIKGLPSTECQSEKFSVPFNAEMVLALTNIMKVYTQKLKAEFLNNFKPLKISGIQLEKLNEFLVQLRTKSKTQLPNFGTLFSKNSYLQCPDLTEMNKVIKFLYEFIKKDQPSYIENWLSVELDRKITSVLDEIAITLAEPGSDFKKKTVKTGLIIQPCLEKYDQISAKMINLANLYQQKISIETKKNNQNSEFFQQYTEKVYDKTIQQPYQVQQKYTVQETQIKKVNTPISYQHPVPVQRSRIEYRNQTQYETVSVPKNRTVTHYRTQTQTHYGGRRYGLFGPKEKWTTTHQVPYQVNQVYYESEQQAKQVSKPHTVYYTENVYETRVRYQMQDKSQTVPVQKTRMKTLYRDKLIYKDQKKKRLNQAKYDNAHKQITTNISATQKQIDTILNTCYKCPLNYAIPQNNKPNSDKIYSESHRGLLRKWLEYEHYAFSKAQPKRTLQLGC